MGRAQIDTYSSLFTKSDHVNLDETFDRKSALVHVLYYYNTSESELCISDHNLISAIIKFKQRVNYTDLFFDL